MGERPAIKFNGAYCCSHNFLLLKLLEIGLTLASLILALQYQGDALIITIEIICALALVTAIFWALLYMLNINARFPEFFAPLLVGYHLVMAILMVIATVCAAVLWPQFKVPIYIACTITSLIGAIAFTIDTIVSLMWWRGRMDEIVVCPCSPFEAEMNI